MENTKEIEQIINAIKNLKKDDFKNADFKKILLAINDKMSVFTSSPTNEQIMKSEQACEVIVTYGIPTEAQTCRSCKMVLPADQFNYYQARVAKNGFLQRSNAVCHNCSKKENKERQLAFKNSLIPEKPKKGSKCPHCDRVWEGNWHRHHQGDKFIAWLCGHCNMSFSDHRNKDASKKYLT